MSGMMSESQKHRNQTDKREKILDGALRAFARKGYYNTRISEIAAEAGVADGTIYLYFKNKDDLLISLFEDRMEWVIGRLESELERVPGDAAARLEAAVRLHFDLAVEEPDLAEFITVELRQSAKFIKEYKNTKFLEYLNILQRVIETGQAEGTFRSELDARAIARAIFGALDEVLLQLIMSRDASKDIGERVRHVSELFIRGLQSV